MALAFDDPKTLKIVSMVDDFSVTASNYVKSITTYIERNSFMKV